MAKIDFPYKQVSKYTLLDNHDINHILSVSDTEILLSNGEECQIFNLDLKQSIIEKNTGNDIYKFNRIKKDSDKIFAVGSRGIYCNINQETLSIENNKTWSQGGVEIVDCFKGEINTLLVGKNGSWEYGNQNGDWSFVDEDITCCSIFNNKFVLCGNNGHYEFLDESNGSTVSSGSTNVKINQLINKNDKLFMFCDNGSILIFNQKLQVIKTIQFVEPKLNVVTELSDKFLIVGNQHWQFMTFDGTLGDYGDDIELNQTILSANELGDFLTFGCNDGHLFVFSLNPNINKSPIMKTINSEIVSFDINTPTYSTKTPLLTWEYENDIPQSKINIQLFDVTDSKIIHSALLKSISIVNQFAFTADIGLEESHVYQIRIKIINALNKESDWSNAIYISIVNDAFQAPSIELENYQRINVNPIIDMNVQRYVNDNKLHFNLFGKKYNWNNEQQEYTVPSKTLHEPLTKLFNINDKIYSKLNITPYKIVQYDCNEKLWNNHIDMSGNGVDFEPLIDIGFSLYGQEKNPPYKMVSFNVQNNEWNKEDLIGSGEVGINPVNLNSRIFMLSTTVPHCMISFESKSQIWRKYDREGLGVLSDKYVQVGDEIFYGLNTAPFKMVKYNIQEHKWYKNIDANGANENWSCPIVYGKRIIVKQSKAPFGIMVFNTETNAWTHIPNGVNSDWNNPIIKDDIMYVKTIGENKSFIKAIKLSDLTFISNLDTIGVEKTTQNLVLYQNELFTTFWDSQSKQSGIFSFNLSNNSWNTNILNQSNAVPFIISNTQTKFKDWKAFNIKQNLWIDFPADGIKPSEFNKIKFISSSDTYTFDANKLYELFTQSVQSTSLSLESDSIFVRSGNSLIIQTGILEADSQPEKIISSIIGSNQFEQFVTEIMVTNNANDSHIVWENATEPFRDNQAFVFTNKFKSSSNWGVAMKIKLVDDIKFMDKICLNAVGFTIQTIDE